MSIGIGESTSRDLALEEARRRGRVELVRAVELIIDGMVSELARETGEDDLRPPGAYIGIVKQTALRWILDRDTVFEELRYSASRDGAVAAWALAIFDPRVLADALAGHAEASAGWYARLQGSQTYVEFEKHIARHAACVSEALSR